MCCCNFLLKMDGVTCKIANVEVLHGASLEIPWNEITFLVGVNGAGKTTLLKSILNLIPKVSGTITFNGMDIGSLPPYKIARLGISYVPEDCGVFPKLTVEQQLMMPAWLHKEESHQASKTQGKVPLSIEDVYYFFPKLKARMKSKGIHLSGGERKMLGVARALRAPVKLLLSDEPLEGLAPSIRRTVQQLLDDLAMTSNISALITTPSIKQTTASARKLFIDRGEILRESKDI